MEETRREVNEKKKSFDFVTFALVSLQMWNKLEFK